MSGAAQVGECRARALESGALDSWLSRERLLCGADFRSLKFRSWPVVAGGGPISDIDPNRPVGKVGCRAANNVRPDIRVGRVASTERQN
jgi:hypothetical protein